MERDQNNPSPVRQEEEAKVPMQTGEHQLTFLLWDNSANHCTNMPTEQNTWASLILFFFI